MLCLKKMKHDKFIVFVIEVVASMIHSYIICIHVCLYMQRKVGESSKAGPAS